MKVLAILGRFLRQLLLAVLVVLLLLLIVEQVFPPQPQMPEIDLARANDAPLYYAPTSWVEHVGFMNSYTTDAGEMVYIDR